MTGEIPKGDGPSCSAVATSRAVSGEGVKAVKTASAFLAFETLCRIYALLIEV